MEEGSGAGAEKELERRTKYLNSLLLLQKKKKNRDKQKQYNININDPLNIRVRASDMAPELEKRAFKCARDNLDSMLHSSKLDSKRLALALKKVPLPLPLRLAIFFVCGQLCVMLCRLIGKCLQTVYYKYRLIISTYI